MSENNTKETKKAEVKKGVNFEERLVGVDKQLGAIKSQIQQVEQRMVQTQRQLQAAKDKLMQDGLELQGQQKLLVEIVGEDRAKVLLTPKEPIKVEAPKAKTEATKAEAPKEVIKPEVKAEAPKA